MPYVNAGASDAVTRNRFATKKAFKEAVKADPRTVHLDGTSPLGLDSQYSGLASDLEPGVYVSVCGPDPYTRRKWYATVELVNGKIKVN